VLSKYQKIVRDMMFMGRYKLLIFALAAFAAPASSTTFYEEKFTCPIGGEKFKAQSIMSHSSWGQQPDGMPMGSLMGPVPMVECPKNGLILFEEFDNPTIEKLKPLIADPEFQALRKTESQYYRLWWLFNKLGRDPRQQAWLMIQASWEAAADPEKRNQYQQRYSDMIMNLPRKDDADWDWVYLQARAANALRETAQFDAAKALIARLPLAQLAVVAPEPNINEKGKNQWEQITNQDAIDAAEQRNSWVKYFKDISDLIENQVTTAKPITMLPLQYARYACENDLKALSDFEKTYCGSPIFIAAVEKDKREND
jgi:hypothetical protein